PHARPQSRRRSMQFMLILSEEPGLVVTDGERQDAVQRTGEFAMKILGEGKLKGGSPLRPVTEARRIRSRNGQTRVTDGPFAEAKEVIAGYFIIEAGSLDEAVQIAAGCPNAEFGSVEVREIVPVG
ncbi:MAG TPA: YciI family protein, partial [Streptosporangiaceae bacterium]|nr:YciI family protein [Streptosporangiaceae bacterium]